MPTCQVFAVSRRRSGFQWKWKETRPDGTVIESKDKFALYYECVLDARKNGYEPQIGHPAPSPLERSL